MSEPVTSMGRRIRISSLLILLGLAVEAISFLWSSPLAFFLFAIGGGGLTLLGIGFFLLSLVRHDVATL
jgi:hypothetical protein